MSPGESFEENGGEVVWVGEIVVADDAVASMRKHLSTNDRHSQAGRQPELVQPHEPGNEARTSVGRATTIRRRCLSHPHRPLPCSTRVPPFRARKDGGVVEVVPVETMRSAGAGSIVKVVCCNIEGVAVDKGVEKRTEVRVDAPGRVGTEDKAMSLGALRQDALVRSEVLCGLGRGDGVVLVVVQIRLVAKLPSREDLLTIHVGQQSFKRMRVPVAIFGAIRPKVGPVD
mmetsp:Transcript_39607/g.92987  ORF Transcript_39607/g.92987 Transcript_39607/m.92987 type:complete len:229 (-) Transcript_39607:387-1073(-)